MICPICGQLPGDPMTRPFGCFGRGERECTLRASEALGKHGRPLAWAADELRRELADAKAEVERLRAERDDAHVESAALRAALHEIATVLGSRDMTMTVIDARRTIAERDELRRLAWEWCIEAKRQSDAAVIRADWADGFDVRIRECGHVIREEPVVLPLFGGASLGRPTFDAMAEKAGPLPTAVLADSPDVEPIESLGPVPADVPGSLRSRVEWLVRDAVRRGAKLEGE